MQCSRGDVVLVDFGEHLGTSVQSYVRPAVVISNNRANEYSPVISVVPLTAKADKKSKLPTHIMVSPELCTGITKSSQALAEQTTCVDKKMILKKIGHVQSRVLMSCIEEAVKIQMGLKRED